jgi:S-DNA-T family DNA segregation ATPase FtsK/SpoIIIE
MTRQSIVYRQIDAVRGPQVFAFRLRLADPDDLSKTLGLEEQLALTMNVPAVRVARNLGTIEVEVSLPKAFHRALPVTALDRKGKTWIALGKTPAGSPVHVNLAGNRTCHTLITGMTGSGKTVTEQLIAWTLAQDNDPGAVNLLLIDGKGGRAWWGFEGAAHLAHPVIGDPGEAVDALTWAVTELDRRKNQSRIRPRLYIVVDEVRELLDVGGQPVAESIRRIAALGRELGIHIILATQHALVDALGGSIAKANLPLRLTGRVADSNAAYVATGVKNSGAEALQGNGDFLLTLAGDTHRLQIAQIRNRELGKLDRTDHTPRINFGDYDPSHVLDVTDGGDGADDDGHDGRGRPPDPMDPKHVAVALASGRGINWLQERLSVGQDKATRVREFALAVREKLHELGYSVYPISEKDKAGGEKPHEDIRLDFRL